MKFIWEGAYVNVSAGRVSTPLRWVFGGLHKLTGPKVMPNRLRLIAGPRSEFQTRLSGRELPVGGLGGDSGLDPGTPRGNQE